MEKKKKGGGLFASYTYLERPILCLDGDDLISHQLQDAVHDRLKALEDFLVGEGHVAFLDASLGELSFDAHVDSPLLAVVTEVGFYPVLEVHDALGVHLAGRFGAVGQLHLANLGPQDIAKVAVQGRRAARIARAGGALGDGEGLLLLDLVGDQIDRTTAAIDNQDGIVDLEIQQARLGAEHGGRLGLSDEGQPVVVLVT